MRGTGVVFAGDMRAIADGHRRGFAGDVPVERSCRGTDHGCLACTDVTFGLIGHLAELCLGSGGAKVRLDLNDSMLQGDAMGVVSSLHETQTRRGEHAEGVVFAAYDMLTDRGRAPGRALIKGRGLRRRFEGDLHAAVVGAVLSAQDPSRSPRRSDTCTYHMDVSRAPDGHRRLRVAGGAGTSSSAASMVASGRT